MYGGAARESELVAEAQEESDRLGRALVAAEADSRVGDVPPERINALFRSGHTLKGLFGLMGHKDAQGLAHAVENVLERMRMGKLAVTPKAFAALSRCVDHFADLLRDNDEGASQAAAHTATLVTTLDTLAAPRAPQAPIAQSLSTPDDADAQPLADDLRRMLTEYEEYRLAESFRRQRTVLVARAVLQLFDCDTSLPALETSLAAFGEIIARLPSAAPGPEATITFDMLVATDDTVAQVRVKLAQPEVLLHQVLGPQPTNEAPAPAQIPEAASAAPEMLPAPGPVPATEVPPGVTARSGAVGLQTVRVDIRKLDHLMHLVGELGTTRGVLNQLAARLDELPDMQGVRLELLREGARLERRIAMLQAQVLDARMVPLTSLFERLVRAGLEVAADLGVQVQFHTRGGETELDKRIVESLTDPLLHLVRNAVDHGIETAAVREGRGKAPVGSITLTAQAQGSLVLVLVSDDGEGIDADHVAARAVSKGVISQERVDELGADERLRLVLLPGFSTRDAISHVSGRGVGLDVVKTHLEQLGGSVEIATRAHLGTTFSLMAPTTLAILPALIARAGAAHYAIPLAQVVETVELEPANQMLKQGRPTLMLRERALALTNLASLLEGNGSGSQPLGPEPFAVVVGPESRRAAIAVDELVGQQDLVIKPLGSRLRHVRGLAGAAELDDHELIIVLDVMVLLADAVERTSARREAS